MVWVTPRKISLVARYLNLPTLHSKLQLLSAGQLCKPKTSKWKAPKAPKETFSMKMPRHPTRGISFG